MMFYIAFYLKASRLDHNRHRKHIVEGLLFGCENYQEETDAKSDSKNSRDQFGDDSTEWS